METHHCRDATAAAAQVLVQMHQLLWQASAEADQRTRARPDLTAVDLAFVLSHHYALVYDLVPHAYRAALLDRPAVTGADPVDLVRQAERLSRTVPVHHFPPGTTSVLVQLIDTVREHS